MAFKFLVLAAFVAAANAGIIAQAPLAYAPGPAIAKIAAPLAYAQPLGKAVAVQEDYDPNPQYSYSYDIQDALTGDSKGQQETRQGDVVQGSYSVNDPDGTRRTVEYTADPVNGFNAIVHREPLVAAGPIAKVAAPIAYAPAPIAKVAAPIAYAHAPIAYAQAPVARLAAPLAAAPLAYAQAPIAKYASYAAPAQFAHQTITYHH